MPNIDVYEVKGVVSWPTMPGFEAGQEEVTERYIVPNKMEALTKFFDEYSEIGWKVESWPKVSKIGEGKPNGGSE